MTINHFICYCAPVCDKCGIALTRYWPLLTVLDFQPVSDPKLPPPAILVDGLNEPQIRLQDMKSFT